MTARKPPRKLRRLWLPGHHRFLIDHSTNHLSVDVWLFSSRLNFKAEWSGHKTTHWWRIRKWGWREWVDNCVCHYRVTEPSFGEPGADPFEALVGRIALALGWKSA